MAVAQQGVAPAGGRSGAGGQSLSSDRDRFVALAFCWADALFELDGDGTIVFCTGPVRRLTGADEASLVGTPLINLIAEKDRRVFESLLGSARKRGRLEAPRLHLAHGDGTAHSVSVAGYYLSQLGGHFFVGLRNAPQSPKEAGGRTLKREAATGLYDATSFAALVKDQVAGGSGGVMTLFELPGMADLRSRLGPEASEDLLSAVGTLLKANSVGGDTAAAIGDGRYGMLHDSGTDISALERELAEVTQAFDPAGTGVKVETATVPPGADDLSEDDFANGLVFAINKLRSSEGSHFSLNQLFSNMGDLVNSAVRNVNTFKQTVKKGDFFVALQPILNVMTGDIHHYEALVRFNADKGASPFETITFAEETGMIADFDLAMARKVADWLSKNARTRKISVALNMSGSSVTSLAYTAGIHQMLMENRWLKGKLLFEVTESSRLADLDEANHFIQKLRVEGYPVCLDDFGAGAANFQYMSTMEVDVVKLDGSAVRNAQKARKGRAFLKALCGLCKELKVETIAEMVDTEESLKFVRDCGVDHVQGYLFGKPSPDIREFDKLIDPAMFPKRPHG